MGTFFGFVRKGLANWAAQTRCSVLFSLPSRGGGVAWATGVGVFLLVISFATLTLGQSAAQDPGVRGVTVDSGKEFAGVSADPALEGFFTAGLSQFIEVEPVIPAGGKDGGLGPGYNSDSCGSCHSQPATGGTSPRVGVFPSVGRNPQVDAASRDGATNSLPFFVTDNGPVREARFKFFLNRAGGLSDVPDGGVHDLFTIQGRTDATNVKMPSGQTQTCVLSQPNFDQMRDLNNLIFRIPTPVFGAGLLENIDETTILANMRANREAKEDFGISGHPNRNGNDGTIARFGWKAQNKSLQLFAGEAYNVEMGITSEMFPNERGFPPNPPPASCIFNPTPETIMHFQIGGGIDTTTQPSDITHFANFMRFLDQPTPACTDPSAGMGTPCSASIQNGRRLFVNVAHCALCHTPTMQTAGSNIGPFLDHVNANLFSDLLVHHMGSGLADGVSQGSAGPDEFRTAPLWGLGQRIFFLHDGRTTDLIEAIRQHGSPGSEANASAHRYNRLSESDKQDLLNFLRSL
jgi:CxxC motif-containing protein (DUF1111 family)